MKPLTERMTKGGAAKAWIKEVEAKDREIESLEQTKDQYLDIIDLLAREKEELEAETEALSELLSPLVDVELERDKLKDENKRLRELPERIKRMCHIKEAWQADGALCDIEDYIDTLLECECDD